MKRTLRSLPLALLVFARPAREWKCFSKNFDWFCAILWTSLKSSDWRIRFSCRLRLPRRL